MLASETKPWMKYWGDQLPSEQDAECSVFELLKRSNEDYPNEFALNYFDRRITFRQFFDNIITTAKAYLKLGVKKGDILTVVSVMTPETIYTFYALSLIGATPNLADPRTSTIGLHEYISESHSRLVVVLDQAYPKIKKAQVGTEVEHVLVVSPADSLPAFKKIAYRLTTPDKNEYDEKVIRWPDFFNRGIGAPDFEVFPYDPQHAALIVHTGGTTGTPKGVMLSDKAINALAMQYIHGRGKRQQSFLNIMPPFIAYGYGVGVHSPLLKGVEVVLIPAFDPKKFGKLINKYHPEHIAGVPLHYQMLAADPAVAKSDLSFLLTTGSGGDSISTQAEEEVNAFLQAHHVPDKLTKGYGMTEVSACATACYKDANKLGSVGVPLALTTVSIFKPGTDEELEIGEEGEICITGPNLMLGYYQKPEETANVIHRHRDGRDWVHSGDIGYMDEDGFLFVINRIKRVIIRHDGFKIFPYVIQEAAGRVEGVGGAYAVAVKDPAHKQGNLPHVFIKTADGFSGDPEELIAKVKESCEVELAEYCWPFSYSLIEDVPYTAVGKVDYLALQDLASQKHTVSAVH